MSRKPLSSSYTGARPVRSRKNSPTVETVAEAIAAYMLHHESVASQPSTVQGHQHCLGALQHYCDEHELVQLADLNTEDLQRWVVEVQRLPSNRSSSKNGNICPRTVLWYVRSLRAFFRWCVRRGFVESDMVAYLDLPHVDKPIIRILEPEEFMRLIAACKPDMTNNGSTGPHVVARNEAILWLFYDTGIRLAELCNFKLADFDRARGTIIVNGKGRKERKIALGRNALQVMTQYLTQWRDQFASADYNGHVFITEDGPLTRAGIKMFLLRIRHRAGLDERRVHPHLFRHTFAVRYLMAGGDVFTLQELLGHEDMETIRNYMHLADVNVQIQKRKFSPGDQLQLPAKKMRRAGFRSTSER